MSGKRKYLINKEQIRHLYIDERLSLSQTAKVLGVSSKTVSHRLKEYGIPTRSISEGLLGNKLGLGHKGWNRGLTKKDHPSIQSMADKLTGRPGTRLGCKASAETRQKLSESKRNSGIKSDTTAANKRTRELWADPEWKEMMLKKLRAAFQKKPNKSEQKLIDIFTRNGMSYEYVGDGKVILNGLIPDFLNVDGKKKIVELFGRHWHDREDAKWHQTELGRIMAYNSVGFDCLVIWENELKEETKVLQKLKAFDRKRR